MTSAINAGAIPHARPHTLGPESLFLVQYWTKSVFASQGGPAHRKDEEPVMEYRTLGKTGLKVSVVSHGLGQLREPAVIFKALDLGINFFDTAHVYQNGNSEILLGKVLKEYGRKKVFIANSLIFKTHLTTFADFLSLLAVDKVLTTLYMSSKSTQGFNLSQGGRHE